MPEAVNNTEVVAALRAARDRLNHGGHHWIKAALTRWVRKDAEPGSPAYKGRTRKTKEFSEKAFCSLGAINATTVANGPARTAAKIALAETIDKSRFEYLQKQGSSKLRAAENIIIIWNDRGSRRWPEVRDAFTKTARRLSQRKS